MLPDIPVFTKKVFCKWQHCIVFVHNFEDLKIFNKQSVKNRTKIVCRQKWFVGLTLCDTDADFYVGHSDKLLPNSEF